MVDYSDIYVASFERNEVFNLKTFTFVHISHEFEVGEVCKLVNGGVLVDCRPNCMLSAEEKQYFDQNPVLLDRLTRAYSEVTYGLSPEETKYWLSDFNQFLHGFCTHQIEVQSEDIEPDIGDETSYSL